MGVLVGPANTVYRGKVCNIGMQTENGTLMGDNDKAASPGSNTPARKVEGGDDDDRGGADGGGKTKEAIKDGKVLVYFKSIGNAPILKQQKFKISAKEPFAAVVTFLRKQIKIEPSERYVRRDPCSPIKDSTCVVCCKCCPT